MIETKVPKDIRRFKGKAIGPFNFRQVICIIIAIIFCFIIYSQFLKDSGLTSDVIFFVLITCALPILAFSIEPDGMKMEDYIKTVLYKTIMYPNKRKNITVMSEKKETKKIEELKQINKEYEKSIKEHPEWKMYV